MEECRQGWGLGPLVFKTYNKNLAGAAQDVSGVTDGRRTRGERLVMFTFLYKL